MRPAKQGDEVEVIVAGAVPVHPFREVGSLKVRSSIGYGAAKSRLLEEAGRHGCDAVAALTPAVQYQLAGGGTAESSREDDLTATCVLYLDWAPDAGATRNVNAPTAPPEPPPRLYPAGTPE